MQKIAGEQAYSYKGFVIFKYESAFQGRANIRWGVETESGKELVADYHSRWACKDFIDQGFADHRAQA